MCSFAQQHMFMLSSILFLGTGNCDITEILCSVLSLACFSGNVTGRSFCPLPLAGSPSITLPPSHQQRCKAMLCQHNCICCNKWLANGMQWLRCSFASCARQLGVVSAFSIRSRVVVDDGSMVRTIASSAVVLQHCTLIFMLSQRN